MTDDSPTLDTADRVFIEFRPVADPYRVSGDLAQDRPVAVRVRQLLKHALRVQGLRCLGVTTAARFPAPNDSLTPTPEKTR